MDLKIQVARKYAAINAAYATQFYDDPIPAILRKGFPADLIMISNALDNATQTFQQDWFAEYDMNTTTTQETLTSDVSNMTNNIVEFYAVQSAIHGSSSVKCLSEDTKYEKMVKKLIKKTLSGISDCYTEQMARVVQLQSVVIFRMEDLVLNARGYTDQICKCMGSQNKSATVDEVRMCLETVSS